MSRRYRFAPFDTWFFRESRPHGSLGGSELGSLFPPPARTVAGALRTLLGKHAGVDWSAFGRGDGSAHRLDGLDLIEQMGSGAALGRLRLRGPYLLRGAQRLYPLPRCIAGHAEGLARLHPGAVPVRCDLGEVLLPEAPSGCFGVHALGSGWLDGAQLRRVLAGEVPERIVGDRELWAEEPRLGIARDLDRRTAEEALLYQTRHVRLAPEVGVEIEVAGITEALHPERGLVRFGGEGRLASVRVEAAEAENLHPGAPERAPRGIALVLLTPADLGGDWKPPGFHPSADRPTTFRGVIGDLELALVSAALGRPIREGGWDVVQEGPRPVVSLVPAGSTWFFELPAGLAPEAAVQRLSGLQLGRDPEIGRGEIAAGYWF